MNEWPVRPLGELIDLFDHRRVPLSSKERSARQGPYPYFGAQGIIDHIDDFIFDGRFILIPEDGENLRSRRLPIAYFAQGRFWVNNHAHVAKAKPGIAVDRFVQSALESTDISPFVTGAAQPKLSQVNLLQIPLRVPPYHHQVAVAAVLDAIDDLIGNNRRRIELLEEMARAIYREWFVHFRYPGHEDIPLVDSPLGPIPDGWRLGVLRDLATEIRRSVKPSAATAELPYLPIDAIDPQSITVWGHRPGTEAKSSLRLFDKGDVVFGAMRAYFHKVCVAPFDGVTRSTCFVLRADPEHYWYAALTLAETSTVAYAAAHSSGSTIPYAKWEGVLSEMPVILPPASVSEAFAERVQPLLGMAQNLADQAQPLASLRDRLLPKLVTGRIDVSHLDLEHLAEAVSA